MKYNYIVIEGNIGAGKTTLAKMLARDYQANLLLEEFADNPFLPKFYQNPEKYAFHVELSFMATRYQQLVNELPYQNLFKTFSLADFYFSKSLLFARITLSEPEYRLYRQIFDIIYKSIPRPDLYVYLHVNVDKLIENIQQRGRDYEQDLQTDYLKQLEKEYFNYMKRQTDMPIVVLDMNNIDFVEKMPDYERVKDAIFNKEHLLGINRYIF
ncbi:MAG: deoxynucleoside kinase [Bacteroidales bacterium]|nr:deoxynucleoside kinase [Bacteroidales bacterium]